MWLDAAPVSIAGLRSDHPWRWCLAAAAAAGCGAYLAARLRGERQSSAARGRTDFDGFLKAKPAHPAAAAAPSRAQGAKAKQPATSFGSFLKDGGGAPPSEQRDSTSFSSFLKGSKHADEVPSHAGKDGCGTASTATTAADGGSAASGPALDSVPVTVLYGTEFGFSKEIAEKLRDRLLADSNFWCAHATTRSTDKQCVEPRNLECRSVHIDEHKAVFEQQQKGVRVHRVSTGSTLRPLVCAQHSITRVIRLPQTAHGWPVQEEHDRCVESAGPGLWTWRTFQRAWTSAWSRRSSAYAPLRCELAINTLPGRQACAGQGRVLI